jgi:tRNA(fMet)-specific endonuclease VapC
MSTGAVLLDSDTLSEIIKGREVATLRQAQEYLGRLGRFQFSIITRYEILRGLKAKGAIRQIREFDELCQGSIVLPLSDEIVVRAADVFAGLRKQGAIIDDGDILIAATAQVHDLVLITNNLAHFRRIPDLRSQTWRAASGGG